MDVKSKNVHFNFFLGCCCVALFHFSNHHHEQHRRSGTAATTSRKWSIPRCFSKFLLAESPSDGSNLSFSRTRFPRLPKTFELCALEKRARARVENHCISKVPHSTGSFPDSCCKEVISLVETALEENRSMA